MTKRELNVWLNTRLIGRISEGNDLWEFAYEPGWASAPDGFDLGPGLPRSTPVHVDGGTLRPVQWYFDNLLPEEGLRVEVSKQAGIKGGDDAFALLEYLGAESAGSLVLLPPDQPVPDAPGRKALLDAELSQRIKDLPRHPLSEGAPKRMSLAGAQNKLPVIYQDDQLFEPIASEASTHILKPNHTSTDYAASVMTEFFTMTLASRIGLPTPAVYRRYVPEPVYIVERFDRVIGKAGTVRLHIIDACQLLNKSKSFKTHPSLDTLSKVVDACRNRLQARQHIFQWLLFCVLIGNDDNHLKNLSFQVDAEGITPTKHYDLISAGTYHTRAFAQDRAIWPELRMGIPLPDATRFGEVRQRHLLEAGAALGIPPQIAGRIITKMVAALRRETPLLLAEVEHGYDKHPAAMVGDRGIELRAARAIWHATVSQMLSQVS
ncbi:HipA domain-containing protein [Pelomonas sp. Root1217]|uniref:HipA domain-containing protein n=1 Tax=Pelomonas sp. Root1217 TaxID=1736430 RepID=UPI0009E96694|nr:HipA domain-containing protein [Pelomonas sp. Root1217]